MSDGLVQILDGNTFVVSDARGDDRDQDGAGDRGAEGRAEVRDAPGQS